MTMKNKLRISYRILGYSTYHQSVQSLEEGKLILDSIADFINFQVERGVFPDHASVAFIDKWDEEEQEWCTVDEDEYED